MKYFKQETNYTCACAVFRMILSHFQEDVPSESEIATILKTGPVCGTHPHTIKEVAPLYDLDILEGENGNLEDLDKLIEDGWVVTMLISVDVPHYVIYLGNNGNHASFNDPWYGENVGHLVKKFISPNQRYPFYRWKIHAKEFDKYYPADFSSYQSTKGWIAFKKNQ